MNRNYLIICLCCVLALNGLGIQELKKQRIELKPETEELIKRENEKKVIQRNSKEKMEETSESKSKSEEKRTNAEKSETKEANQELEISVAIMTGQYTSYFHERIELEFESDYQEENSGKLYLANEKLVLEKEEELSEAGRLVLSPVDRTKENRIRVLSVERGQGTPSYGGTLIIGKEKDGWYVVNRLPLEEYLYGVVPSEMPSDYEKEALKAQAVCARTYAWMQMQKNQDPVGIGIAQVDDSVSYQVYQNSGESETAKEAVDETKGEILIKDGQPITAYYFSTSHGKTSTNEVWEASAPASYLKSVECKFDADVPWYQWKVYFSSERLLEQAKNKLSDASVLEKMEIEKTGEADAVLKLKIETDIGVIQLENEYEIREFLSPQNLEIVRQDESTVKGGKLLPSAYFTLEAQIDENGKPQGYMIHGGGYGHGVGMSQNGANQMAKLGNNYQEILNYFYQEVEIAQISGV